MADCNMPAPQIRTNVDIRLSIWTTGNGLLEVELEAHDMHFARQLFSLLITMHVLCGIIRRSSEGLNGGL